MATTRLQEILAAARSGRAINRAYVSKLAGQLVETPIKYHFPTNGSKQLYDGFAEDFDKHIDGSFSGAPYGVFASKYWNDHHSSADKEVFELCILTIPGSVFHNGFAGYTLSVEDFMDYAGMATEYEKWFKPDCDAWAEQNDGKVASIGDVIYTISYLIDCGECLTIKFDDKHNNEGVTDTQIKEPFRRPDRKEDLYETFIATVWVWLLMIEAPSRIWKRSKIDNCSD